jgi:dihydrofolate reductase
VFVLTHHHREPLEMDGGTTFTFVTDGPEAALAQAERAAGDGRLAIAGGAATLNQYLSLGAIDELRLTSCRSPLARVNASSTASAA